MAKKESDIDKFSREAFERGLTYKQAQMEETLALIKAGKLEGKEGKGSGRKKNVCENNN